MNQRHTHVNPVDDLKIVVLAAGKGKRLQSESVDLPKVLRKAADRPLLDWVLDHVAFVEASNIIIVVGFQAEKVREAMGPAYRYVLQDKQLGTGHAVAVAKPLLESFSGDVLVVYGDMPLLKTETYHELVLKHQAGHADCTMLTAYTEEPPAYGRIIRDQDGSFAGIVEEKDCTAEQRLIKEVNPGVYVFRCEALLQALDGLSNNNAQGEYYLTDVPLIMRQNGKRIDTVTIHDDIQILGVNTPEDLERSERLLKGKSR